MAGPYGGMRGRMTQRSDQFSQQDPRQQYAQPDTEGKEIPAVGEPGSTTRRMDARPDHGEDSYRGSGRLTGRRALVTGGDSGIGRAVAIAFAREGADVAVVHLPNEEEDARETASWVEKAGRKAVTIAADIRDEQQCEQLVERAVRGLGGLDVLVNNAAFQMAQPGGLPDITTEQFDRVVKTNIYGDVLGHEGGPAAPRRGREHHQHRRRSRPTSPRPSCSTTR